MTTNKKHAEKTAGIQRKISFCNEYEAINYTESLARDFPTKTFVEAARGEDFIRKDDVIFTVEVPQVAYIDFSTHWSNRLAAYDKYTKVTDENLFKYLLGNEDEMEECQFNRLRELDDEFFSSFCFLYEMHRQFEGPEILKAFTMSVGAAKWNLVEQVLKGFEKSWKRFEKCEYDTSASEDLSAPFTIGLINRLVQRGIKDEKESNSTAFQENVLQTLKERWEEYTHFFNGPLSSFEKLRRSLAEKYFNLLDSGIVCAMVNEVKDPQTKELFVKKLCDWKIPPSLTTLVPGRNNNAPVVSADRSFSCNHSKTESCRDHPGKLLLLLIRMNLYEMVRFALENGMAVNACSNFGQCKKLIWITERASVFLGMNAQDEVELMHHHASRYSTGTQNSGKVIEEEEDEVVNLHDTGTVNELELAKADEVAMRFLQALKESDKDEPEYLKAEFELVTPLSIAVENSVSGAGIRIVQLLLNMKANPLLCSDVAVKAAVNALSKANTTKLKESLSKAKKTQAKVDTTPNEIKCLKLIYHLVHQDYKKVKRNHCTKVLLYQAAIERRWDALSYLTKAKSTLDLSSAGSLSRASTPRKGTMEKLEEQLGMDVDAFELIMLVIDLLLNDGLQKVYTSYNMVLTPIRHFLEKYRIYLNGWRFHQLYRIIKLAMQENLAGDRSCVVKVLQIDQVQHYLGVNTGFAWEERQLENLEFDNAWRTKLRLESKRNDTITLTTRRSNNVKGEQVEKTIVDPKLAKSLSQLPSIDKTVSYQNSTGTTTDFEKTDKLEKILKLAVKIECPEIVDNFLSKGVVLSDKCRFHMIAMAVKKQNNILFEHLFKNFGNETHLSKSFVIALKGKFYHSIEKVFQLGFKINVNRNFDAKSRAVLNLFQRSLDDVLFEKTRYECDGGLKNKEGFTRQDEEKTFTLLLNFLVKNLDNTYLQRVIKKIVDRATTEYEERIWFYGFHEVLMSLVEHNRLDIGVVDLDFSKLYSMNYMQWILYTRDMKKQFKRAAQPKRRGRNWQQKNAAGKIKKRQQLEAMKKQSQTSQSTEESDEKKNSEVSIKTTLVQLDSEYFINMAIPKVENGLESVLQLAGQSQEIAGLQAELERVKTLLASIGQSGRTQRVIVDPECQRNASRNFDFLAVQTILHGTSEML